MRCFYCGSERLRLAYAGQYNKRKPDYGPFQFYSCRECGSGLTLPPPAATDLAELYRMLEFGLAPATRELLDESSEAAWHGMCARRIARLAGRTADDAFTWIDIGAGGGEIAREMACGFPRSRGIAADIHELPPQLAGLANVEWRRIDMGDDDFAPALGATADVVFATGVWEHVRRPDLFARNALSLVKPGGVLYMTTPNYGSFARRILGSAWPYFFPGEHLCMPTLTGAKLCLERSSAGRKAAIRTRPILIHYGLRYALTKLGMPGIARLLPRNLAAYLPSGAMESVVRLA
jgi:SAM-dependent methyltransferase